MLLNQLVQEHQAGQAGVAAVNDNAEPVSGVVSKAEVEANATPTRQSDRDVDTPQSRAELRSQAMQRFLSAQTDVSDDVLELYKLVCTGFR